MMPRTGDFLRGSSELFLRRRELFLLGRELNPVIGNFQEVSATVLVISTNMTTLCQCKTVFALIERARRRVAVIFPGGRPCGAPPRRPPHIRRQQIPTDS